MTQLAGTLAAVPGGWLADRYNRKSVYLTASIVGLLPPLAFAAISIGAGAGVIDPDAVGQSVQSGNVEPPGSPPPLSMPRFTTVLLLTVLSGLVGGASASASSALMADSLPCGADGQPRNASRDMLLLSLGPVLPGVVLPAPLGRLLSTVKLRGQSYSVFFLCGAACSALSVLALWQVNLTDTPAPGRHPTDGQFAQQRQAPWGARMCDLVCFGRPSSMTHGLPRGAQRQTSGVVRLRRTGSE